MFPIGVDSRMDMNFSSQGMKYLSFIRKSRFICTVNSNAFHKAGSFSSRSVSGDKYSRALFSFFFKSVIITMIK